MHESLITLSSQADPVAQQAQADVSGGAAVAASEEDALQARLAALTA